MKKTELKIATIEDKAMLMQRLSAYASPERPVKVVVSDWADSRTSSQSALIHVLIRELSHSGGWSEDYIKYLLKENYYPAVKWPTSIEDNRVIPKSESKLTKEEESEIIEQLEAMKAEWIS